MADANAGPRPGDPRSSGPRPLATGKDVAWGLLAGIVGAVAVVQVIGLAVALTRLDARPSPGATVLGFLITVVWFLTVYWVVMGAWRRTVWGCPFEHRRTAPAERRCQRHGAVDDANGVTD